MQSSLRRLVVTCAAMLLPGWVAAQESATITGRVTSDAGAPLAATSVFIEGMNVSVITNAEGRYVLTIPAARMLNQPVTVTASLIGYGSESAQITLSSGSTDQDFVLAVDALRLDEIVVTGAGLVTTREKLGNTINSVRGEELLRSNEPNIVSAIAGKAPNVEVSSQAGDPGASSYVRIRGVKTIQGTSQPLFVIDGVPIDNSTFSTNGMLGSTASPNRASDINPADIESMEILKGAAAAAIYGSRAANGVILITTKKGQPGQTQFTLRSSYSIDEVNKGVPLQTRYGQGSDGVTNSGTASYGPELPAGTSTYDHFGEMFGTGHMFDNTLTVSGGSDRTQFYFSAGRLDHDGTVIGPNNWYDRTSVRVNASHRLLENLNVAANFTYVGTDGAFIQKGSNISGLLLGALRSPPEFNNAEYLDENGLHRSYRLPNPTSLTDNRGYDNPFFAVNEHVNTGNTGRTFGNIRVDYDPLEWLTVQYTLGGDYISDDRLAALPPSSSTRSTGQLTRGEIIDQEIDHNLLVTATRTFGENYAGSLTLGHNLNSQKLRRVLVNGLDYVAPDVHQLGNTVTQLPSNEFESLIHTEAVFGQATLDLYNQLYLTAALRNDGSSAFAASQRRHWYPKASAAWTFTELLGDIGGVVSYGKLRGAYGQAGRQPNVYSMVTAFSGNPFGDGGWGSTLNPTQSGLGGLGISTLKGQAQIKPERTKELEVGIDLSLFDQIAALGLTYYDSKSEDVIFSTPLVPSTGFTLQVQNAGTITNKGWELTLDLRPLTTPNVAWDIGFQWATNENRVENLEGAEFVLMTGSFNGQDGAAVEGYPVGVMRSFDFARCGRGLDIGDVDIDAACGASPNGALYIDEDGFPIQDPTARVIMDPHPDWTGSVRSAVTLFNKLRIGGLLDVKQGGQVWNGTRGALYNFGTHKDTEMRGETRVFGQNGFHDGPVAGPGAGKAVEIGQSWFAGLGGGFGPVASQFVEDGSYVKLREISLGYTLDGEIAQSLGMSRIDLNLAGRNLKTWTDYTGIDPETNLGGAQVSLRGIDYFNNPQTRSFVFTVELHR